MNLIDSKRERFFFSLAKIETKIDCGQINFMLNNFSAIVDFPNLAMILS